MSKQNKLNVEPLKTVRIVTASELYKQLAKDLERTLLQQLALRFTFSNLEAIEELEVEPRTMQVGDTQSTTYVVSYSLANKTNFVIEAAYYPDDYANFEDFVRYQFTSSIEYTLSRYLGSPTKAIYTSN